MDLFVAQTIDSMACLPDFPLLFTPTGFSRMVSSDGDEYFSLSLDTVSAVSIDQAHQFLRRLLLPSFTYVRTLSHYVFLDDSPFPRYQALFVYSD